MKFAIYALLSMLQGIVVGRNPDNHNNFLQTCMENGFASESYTVFTEDGYVSQLYRIPGKFGESGSKKPVVLL